MNQSLETIESLYKEHKYKECLRAISKLESQDKKNSKIQGKIHKFKISSLIRLEKYDEAHDICDQIIEVNTKKNEWDVILDSLLTKVRISFLNNEFTEAWDFIYRGMKIVESNISKNSNLLKKKCLFLFWKGQLFLWGDKVNSSIECFRSVIKCAEKSNSEDLKYTAIHRLGNSYGVIGEYKDAIKQMKIALKYFEQKNSLEAAGILHNIGVTYAEIGEYKKVRDYFKKKAKLVRQTPHDVASIGDSYWREGHIEKGMEYMEKALAELQGQYVNKFQQAVVTFIQANLYSRKGEQDIAYELYQEAIDLCENVRSIAITGFSHVGIANSFYHRGELDKAISYAKKALEIFSKNEKKYGLGWAHFILSKIYDEKGDIENALNSAQISLDLRMFMGNKQDISQSIREIISILLRTNSHEDVNEYFKQLEKLTLEKDNRIIKHNCLLSKALILKSKGRPKHWTQAIDILEEIVAEPIAEYNTTLVALINLCELLLNEFSISSEEEIIMDLETHTSRLLDIAQKQNSYTLRVEAYHMRIIFLWLQAQHSRIDINIGNAKKLLKEASELADSHGLVKLSKKIKNQNDKMLVKLENWDEFIRRYYEFLKV